ncbi:hypothetical protein [Flavobacterium haoranii]|uniref:Uncharacterized protein n=1 Tax=Flavobacterium haoranii TaxID=683124 RepID=A0A1M6I094_9FLAO|nr:hypothetical protein [Flavobacterium haoranii]SHJ27873.1 hypothetical protein SAMN05444337_1715 [Flavobacterium haoranii]
MKDSNLEDIKIKNGFIIPDGYFENFENKIMKQIENEEPKVISIFRRKYFYVASIAATILLVIGGVFTNRNNINSIDDTTLENYLVTEVSSYDLIDKIDVENIASADDVIELSNDNLENYLMNTPNLDYYLNE